MNASVAERIGKQMDGSATEPVAGVRMLEWKVIARVFDYLLPRADYPEFPSFELEEFKVKGRFLQDAINEVTAEVTRRSFAYTASLPPDKKQDGFMNSRWSCFVVSIECLTAPKLMK